MLRTGVTRPKKKNESYEFSNWRDDFQATEYESVDIIKPEPLQPTEGIGSQMLDEKCWKGYEKKGMKTMFGKRYPNCVKKKKTEKKSLKFLKESILVVKLIKEELQHIEIPLLENLTLKKPIRSKFPWLMKFNLVKKRMPVGIQHKQVGMKKKGNCMVQLCSQRASFCLEI